MRNTTKFNDFKGEIARRGMTLKEFCENHGFHYVMFNQAINGLSSLRPEYEDAISIFMNNTQQIHLFPEVEKNGSSQKQDS